MNYSLKQGNMKQTFSTGAQRDEQVSKARIDLISPIFLERLGMVLTKGAEHYGERNWEKGMPLSRLLASAARHLNQTIDGLEDEDHPAQAAWNLMAYIHTLHRIGAGSLPGELDDLPREKNLGKREVFEVPCKCGDYKWCPLCKGRLEDLLREKNLSADLTFDKKEPTIGRCVEGIRYCPKCSHHLGRSYLPPEFHEVVCPKCGADLTFDKKEPTVKTLPVCPRCKILCNDTMCLVCGQGLIV